MKRSVIVVLVRPEGPIHIGMICRLCTNLEVKALRIVRPACDIFSLDVKRFAMHAHACWQAIEVYDTLQEAVADCQWVVATSARLRQPQLPQHDIQAIPALLQQHQIHRLALVFGPEKTGLTQEDLRSCQVIATLKSSEAQSSYNLSHAVAIVLYLLCSDSVAEDKPVAVMSRAFTHADHRQLRKIQLAIIDLLQRSDYFQRVSEGRFISKLLTMLSRWHLTEQDVRFLWSVIMHFNRRFVRDKDKKNEKEQKNSDIV